MKKIFVATYCDWRSYGAVLQALALQSQLRELGCESQVLCPEPQPPKKLKPSLPLTGGLAQRILDTHKLLVHAALQRKYRNTHAFIRAHVSVRYCGSYAELNAAPPEADAYLAGSDQVWRPDRVDPFFFLAFAPEGSKKLSYAASMGSPDIPAEQLAAFRGGICGFDTLSVREPDNRRVIAALTDQPVHRHIDPVFLWSPEQWRGLARPYPGMDRPYILVYAIYWDHSLNRQLERLHRQTGMDVVVLANSWRRIYANRWIFDADPGQFLWLVDHAAMVVTSSFHGTAMSVIFEKRFAAVINPAAASRITGLLEVLDIREAAMEALFSGEQPDYAPVRERIRQEQARSRQYLNEVLASI